MTESNAEHQKPSSPGKPLKVAIAPDHLTAVLTLLEPASPDATPTVDAVRSALADAGVVFGIDEAALSSALASPVGAETVVARGVAPTPGIDGWLEPLVDLNEQRHPRVDQEGVVDFRNLGTFPSVGVGDALMRRHPPRPGTPGKGVSGKDLPAAAPKDLRFGVRLQGVKPDPDDPDLLRAEVAGQPIMLRDGVNVEPVVRFDSVDLKLGNVDFAGSVEIRGDVQSGMRIKVAGDVTVGGVIESAEIIAGGNVVARGGIVGHTAQTRGEESGGGDTARIVASGTVQARYIENAIVQSQQSVVVDEAIVQSSVMAVGEIAVGRKGSGKGRIVGGFLRATNGVSVEVLGSQGSGQTRVFVGVNPLIQRAIDENQARLKEKLKENGELLKVQKLLKTRPDKAELLDKAEMTLKKCNEEIAEIMDEVRRLESRVGAADQARIGVGKEIHGGVMVAIGKKSRFISEDQGSGTFMIEEGELVYRA